MANLRERKKENTRMKIFQTAHSLFEEQGFHKTTMEKIAVSSEIGVGTLYNYFPSKIALLFSIIENGTGNYIEDLKDVLLNCTEIKKAVFDFYQIYLRCFSTFSKNVWREVFGEIFNGLNNNVKLIDLIDKDFIEELYELLVIFKKRGIVKDITDTEAAVSALYSLLGYNVIRYLLDSSMSEAELLQALHSQAELVLNSLISEF